MVWIYEDWKLLACSLTRTPRKADECNSLGIQDVFPTSPIVHCTSHTIQECTPPKNTPYTDVVMHGNILNNYPRNKIVSIRGRLRRRVLAIEDSTSSGADQDDQGDQGNEGN